MKKIIFEGTDRLKGQITSLVNRVVNRGYKPNYVREVEFNKDSDTCNRNSNKLYFLHQEITDEDVAELAYAVEAKLIGNRNEDIYIVNMPDEEQFCYNEVKYWLDMEWIKLYVQEVA